MSDIRRELEALRCAVLSIIGCFRNDCCVHLDLSPPHNRCDLGMRGLIGNRIASERERMQPVCRDEPSYVSKSSLSLRICVEMDMEVLGVA